MDLSLGGDQGHNGHSVRATEFPSGRRRTFWKAHHLCRNPLIRRLWRSDWRCSFIKGRWQPALNLPLEGLADHGKQNPLSRWKQQIEHLGTPGIVFSGNQAPPIVASKHFWIEACWLQHQAVWGFSVGGAGRPGEDRIEEDECMDGQRPPLWRPDPLDLKLGWWFIFQQGNSPQNTAKVSKKWYQDQSVNVLQRPSRSPHLNPIEKLWRALKMCIKTSHPTPNKVKIPLGAFWGHTPWVS